MVMTYLLFLIMYTLLCKGMQSEDFILLENRYKNAMRFVLDDATAKQQETRQEFDELEKKLNENFSMLEQWVEKVNAMVNGSVNVINQLVQPALQDANACVVELNQLKNQLFNELTHLTRYRKNIEQQFKQHHDRLEKLELLYTSLRFDVNVIDLAHIKQQVHFIYSSAASSLNGIQKIQENLDKAMLHYTSDFKSELKKENEKFIKHIDIITQMSTVQMDRIDQLERTNKKLEYWLQAMTVALLTLTAFILLQ